MAAFQRFPATYSSGPREPGGGRVYLGGTPHFDERTGRYTDGRDQISLFGNQQGQVAPAAGQPQSRQKSSQRSAASPGQVPDMLAYAMGQAQPRQQSLGTPYGQSYSNLPGQWSPVQAATEKPRTLRELEGSLATRAGNFQESARSKVQADPYINSLNNQLAAARRAADAAREAHRNYKHTPGDMNSAIGLGGLLKDADNKQRIVRELEKKLSKEKIDAEARFVAEDRLKYAGGLGYDTSDPGVRFAADSKPGQVDIDALRRSTEGSQYQYAPVTTHKRPDGSEVNRTYLPGMTLEQVPPADSPFGGQLGGLRQPQFFSSYTPPQIFAQPQFRPSFQALYTNFDGSVSTQPNYSLRDAFVQSINDSMIPYQTGRMSGAPQFDFQSLLGTAQNMSRGGFQNPLAGLFG